MKKIYFLLFTMAAFTAQSQTADEIINKHIEARGGLEKLRALQTMIMEGSMVQQGTDVAMKYYYANNKGTKVEFTAAGQTGYNIVTPTEGWTFNPFAGNTSAEALPEATQKEQAGNLDLAGPLVDYKAKGHTVEYLGKQNIQGVDFYKVKLTRKNGKVTTYYFDKNYLAAQVVTTAMIQGSEQEITTEYSDFRKTPEGYTLPFKRIAGGNEITFDKVEINPKIDDSVFKPSN